MKLAAERLESREVPAAFWWAPPSAGNLQATTANNWMMGPNTPYARWSTLPDWDDHLLFQSSNGGDYDCNVPLWATPGGEEGGPPAGSPDFAGIHIADNYSKTVNLQRSPTVGTVELASANGKIAQNDPGTAAQGSGGTLTIKTLLTWTAGTLNNGSLPGVVTLAATATGLAAPADGSEVKLGSTLKLLGNTTNQTGSTLELNDGTFTLTNNQVGFHLMAGSLLGVACGAPATTEYTTPGEINIKDNSDSGNTASKIFIDEGATANIYKKDSSARGVPKLTLKGNNPLILNSGTLKINKGAQVQFTPTGTFAGQPATGIGHGLRQTNAAAVTEISAGSKVICGKKTSVDITKGKLKLLDSSAVTQRDDEQDNITIDSPDTDKATATLNIGEAAEMLHASNTKGLLKLEVNGNFAVYGTVTMVVSHIANKNDTIECNGIVDFYPDSHLDVWWYQETGDSLVPNTWVLITSTYTGEEQPTADSSTLRQVADPNYLMTVGKETSADKKQVMLKSRLI